MTKVRYLSTRHGSWHYYRRVPNAYRRLEHQTFIRIPIGRVDKLSRGEAAARVAEINAKIEASWAAADRSMHDQAEAFAHAARAYAKRHRLPYKTAEQIADATEVSDDELITRIDAMLDGKPRDAETPVAIGALGAVRAAPEEGADGGAISDVYRDDVALHGGDSRRVEAPVRRAVEEMIECWGDVEFARIDHKMALAFCAHLQANKRNGRPASPATVIRRLGPSKAIWNRWARRAGCERRNPFEGVRPEQSRDASTEDRLPFHLAHLEAIRTASLSATTRAQLALMRATGVGPMELIGIRPEHDFITEGDVPHILVRGNERRDLKTAHRNRSIPLVGVSVDEARAALIETREFEERIRSMAERQRRKGTPADRALLVSRFANAISAKLSKALRVNAGINGGSRLSPYSFRHTLKQALRDAQADTWIAGRIMGHNSESGAPAGYGAPRAKLAAMRDALIAAQAMLGRVELSIYDREGEMPPALRKRALYLEAQIATA